MAIVSTQSDNGKVALAAGKPLLSVTGLYFSIGDLQILNGLDISVTEGETTGIIGPNGSGKTTLFNCLSGFCLPHHGNITFKNSDITRQAPHRRALLGLGRVFQSCGVYREMSILENIVIALESRSSTSFLRWRSDYRKHCRRALELLELVNLAHRSKDKAGSLSGGQLRLLEIVRTLAFEADLFLLDEPTAGVSPKMKHEVVELLKKLQALKKTVLIIEHDINFIDELCRRILVLDVGRIVLDDTPQAVRGHPMLHEIYFGSPNKPELKPESR